MNTAQKAVVGGLLLAAGIGWTLYFARAATPTARFQVVTGHLPTANGSQDFTIRVDTTTGAAAYLVDGSNRFAWQFIPDYTESHPNSPTNENNQ